MKPTKRKSFLSPILGLLCAGALISLNTGCGTTANLSGLSASVNVAQKGVVAGLTVSGSTNGSVTVGAVYGTGTNTIGGAVTVP